MIHEVVTLLRARDEATAVLQRYAATLRELQTQVDSTLGSFRAFRNAMAPTAQALARQREALDLTLREAKVRAGIGAETVQQSDAMLAARRASLAMTQDELAAQRGIAAAARGPAWRGAANRLGNDSLWGGAAILGAAAYATQKAINFNQTALEADMALGGYNRSPAQRAIDIRALQRAAMKGSEATGFFDAEEILQGLKAAASSGARPLVERMGMGVFTQIAPALSQYMDIIGRLKGESPSQAAVEGLRASHMFGAYTPAAITRTLNAQAALALLMPDKMSTATTTAAYAVPSGVQLAGIPQEAILALIATADQSGIGKGRAGARLKDYIETIAVHQSKARESAKSALGLGGALDSHGNLDLMKSFEILQSDARRLGSQDYRNLVRTAFGSPGSVVAAMFGDPSKSAMFDANRGVIGAAVQNGDLNTIQGILKGGVAGQEALMLARLNNDIIKFGQYGLPIAVRFFDVINPKLKQFGDWLDTHPKEAAKLFDDLVHVGEGLLMFGGALKTLSIISGTISALRTLYTTVSGVGAAARTAGPAIDLVTKGLGGLAAVIGPGSVIAVTAAFWAGIAKNLHDAKDPKVAQLLKWGASGANSGVAPPGTGGTVDIFGRPIVHRSSHSSAHHSTVHVEKVTINFPNVKDGPGAKLAMEELFAHPMTLLKGGGSYITHSNIPQPWTVPDLM